MDGFVKQFIEKNIELIKSKNFYDLLCNAYACLSDSHIKEVMETINQVLEVDLIPVATSVAMRCLELSLGHYLDDDAYNNMELPSLIRRYMDNTCGVPYRDFESHVIAYPPEVEGIRMGIEEDGTPYFEKIS